MDLGGTVANLSDGSLVIGSRASGRSEDMTRNGSDGGSRERRSKGEHNVGNHRNEDKEAGVEEDDEGRKESTGVWNKIRRGRRWLRWGLTLERFHMGAIALVVSVVYDHETFSFQHDATSR